ncbi:ABC transporter ATP-binding protein [Roseobacter sp. YSTF-M11]|uniref:ABC transporter ATP-binding protein n=2 Tax=Roseobacter insulae TaxID=2859783 RepID=A0A9X1FZR1_9RHOB|nr:ABC transporter ATP-binding protein [Roseobacter insulae]
MSEWHQAYVCLLAVVFALIDLIPLELQRRIVNEVVESQNVPLLLQYGAIYLVLIIVHKFGKFVLKLYQGWLSESATIYTRKHLLGLYGDQSDPTEDSSGRTVSIVGSEVEKLGGFVGESLSQACVNITMLLGVLGYMLVVEPRIALFALAFLIPQILITPLMQKRLNELVEERVGYIRDLGDEISNMTEAKHDYCLAILPKIFSNRMKYFLLKFALKTVLNVLNALGPFTVLIFGGYLVMQGQTEIGVIVAFISGFERMSGPVRELITFYRVAAQATVQHRMIAKWVSKHVDQTPDQTST